MGRPVKTAADIGFLPLTLVQTYYRVFGTRTLYYLVGRLKLMSVCLSGERVVASLLKVMLRCILAELI